MKKMVLLMSVSCLSGSVYAQCGILPGSAPGDVITVGGLPSSYGVLDSGPGTMIFPTNWGNIFDHLIAGTYIGARTDVVISYTTNPIGIPRPAYYTQGGNSAVNINTDCDPHDYEIQLVQTVNQNESWSISETVSQTYSEQLSVSFGTDKSTTPITMGLSNSAGYSRTSGLTNSYTSGANIGNGASFGIPVTVQSCHKHTVMPYVDVQDHATRIEYYQAIHSLSGFYDTTGNGQWDTRALFSIFCGTGSNGHVNGTGSASVVVSGFSFEDRGAVPVPASQCPCGGGGGGGDMDDDGIPDDVDEDMDGDGIGNDHDNDTDGDGTPNSEDTDDDNDGIPDSQDDSPTGTDENDDVDGDGVPNGEDDDIDGDGVLNEDDDDMDGDGVDNDEDKDDDGDGITDFQEILDAIRRFVDWVRDTIDQIA